MTCLVTFKSKLYWTIILNIIRSVIKLVMIHFLIHLFSCFFVVVFEVKTIKFSINFKDNAQLCTALYEL